LALRAKFGDGGQHRAKDFADRGEIIARDPMGEFEQFWSEGWKKIDGLGNFANLGGGRGVLDALNDYAD